MTDIKVDKTEAGIEIPIGGKTSILGMDTGNVEESSEESKEEQEEHKEEEGEHKEEGEKKEEHQEEEKKEEEEQETKEYSSEEIETKLGEINEKEDADLTDEDKNFIEKYTEEPFINKIMNEYGYIPDEHQFTDDESGIADYIKTVEQRTRAQAVEDVYKSDPKIVASFRHYVNDLGGDPKRFMETMYPQRDFGTIEINEDNVEQQKTIIREHGRRTGRNAEAIEKEIDRFEEHGLLYDTSVDLQKEIAENDKHKEENLIKKQEKQREIENNEIATYWETRRESLNKRDRLELGIPIPKDKKDIFHNYRSLNADGKGNSQVSIDHANLSEEERELVDYVIFNIKNKNGNKDFLNTMVNNREVTRRTRKLKKEYKKRTENRNRNIGARHNSEGYQSWR